MKFTETKLRGAFIITPDLIKDERGFFARTFCRREFEEHGLNSNLVQCNISFNAAMGTLRGMHYQAAPHEEAKLVRCTRGAIYDVIIDLREGSPTVREWFGIELTPDSGLMLYAPEGFAHGYQSLQDDTEMYYMTSAPYAPAAARGVLYDDPAFGVRWPLPVSVISEADRDWPDFKG